MISYADYTVNNISERLVFSNQDTIPMNNTALLLGTNKTLKSGNPNEYFYNRIEATANLYKTGKIRKVVVSGDNRKKNYNEPEDMRTELVKRGVDNKDIYLDYAGFRTFDSVYRMKAIFGQQSFTIISQEFHNKRALFIAHKLGLNAIAYNAGDVSKYMGFKTQVREKLARVKMLLDFVFNTQPKFLGEKVTIE
jgi:SanA protein